MLVLELCQLSVTTLLIDPVKVRLDICLTKGLSEVIFFVKVLLVFTCFELLLQYPKFLICL